MNPTAIANATPASSVLPMCPQNTKLVNPIRKLMDWDINWETQMLVRPQKSDAFVMQSMLWQGFDAYSRHLCLILQCFQLNSEFYSCDRGAELNCVDVLHLFKCGRFFHFLPNISFVSTCTYLASHFHFIVRTEISKYSNL